VGAVTCPFCGTVFARHDDWCPHLLGSQADLTLDDHKDFLSGEFPAEEVADEEGTPYYFLDRSGGGEGE
jgi:hypothetical protein